MDDRETTIQDVRYMCTRGAFRAYARSGGIYLEDCTTGETVTLREPAPRLPREDRAEETAENAVDMGSSQKKQYRDDGPYKGFLLIRCEECGAVEAYCAKNETYAFRCRKCKAVTPLEKLRPAYMHCKCGEEFRYKTNIRDRQLSHTCISCGAPVDMEINRRGTAFVTIGERR
jgi:endogenous inhibitor of DNA gyrase (YacG/DUF329 family)